MRPSRTPTSRTVTSNVAAVVFPARSVDVQRTVVVPTGKLDPEAGKQVTESLTSTRSLAETLNVTGAPDALTALTDRFGGTMTVGGVVSWTVAWNVVEEEFPAPSRAEHK